MPLKLLSPGGGSVTLNAASTAATTTLNIPAVNGNIITSADTGTVVPTLLANPLTTLGSQTLSGTYTNFTNIPSWVRRITIMISYLQNNSGSDKCIQLGTSSGFVTTGYVGGEAYTGGSSAAGNWSSGIVFPTGSSNDIMHGIVTMCLLTANTWVISGCGAYSSSNNTWELGGTIALSSTLTQFRFGSVAGTATWTQGTVNALYE